MEHQWEYLLEARKAGISFPGVRALSRVDFKLRRGEIHALMGQNGAGKSTLLKILSGVYRQDEGSIYLKGRETRFASPTEAQKAGISTVHQELHLIPTLSVTENLFLGIQPRTALGLLNWKKMHRDAEKVLARLNLKIDVTEQLNSYSVAIQQLVAIARALLFSADVLILDEPTSSLDKEEVARLFDVMRGLRSEGLGIVFVTHFLDQMYEISDRATILRNGELVGEFEVPGLSRIGLITAMVGEEASARKVDEKFERRSVPKGAVPLKETTPLKEAAPLLEALGVARFGAVEPFDLRLGRGEVLGLAGLLGSGRSEVARLLFGIDGLDQGKITVEGTPLRPASPHEAIAVGMGFCPEDRKTDGIIGSLSVRENIVLALQANRGIFKRLSRAQQEAVAEKFIESLSIKTPGSEQPVRNLSGGNQQKVIIARWLASNLRLLILDEPTRGIDVAAKTEIQKLILSLADEGLAVLFISSELDEVARCCERVAVLRDRRKIGEFSGDEVRVENIMGAIAQKGSAQEGSAPKCDASAQRREVT
ncbi:MAG: sugar ABC transporter ATP-binding protein [Synergistaceae bacterium]|nr:sugar ABC transporter ATP-binding protein [Synergistaceae bacterium]